MNPSNKAVDGPAARDHAVGFTLIELPIVIAILAVLIGVLLPAVQRTREANNEVAAQKDLKTIIAAENAYFQTHATYSNSFTTLGLGTAFTNNTADGYIFAITLDNTTVSVTAIPVGPGLNASVDYRTDQTGKIFATPDPDAISQHEQTTADIESHAMQVAVQCIQETDTNHTDIPLIRQALVAPNAIGKAFAALAPNGTLTITSIETYSGLASTEMAPLLTAIENDMQFGVGREDIGKISLTLRQALGAGNPAADIGALLTINWSGGDGLSSPEVIDSFCDGSVHFGTVTLRDPEVFSTITQNQVIGAGPGFVWSGPMTITDIYGHEPGAFVVGEMLPAVQAGAAGAKGASHFEAIVIALDATGVMTGGAGFGGMTLGYSPVTDDPVSGSMLLTPPK